MKKFIPVALLITCVAVLVTLVARPVPVQAQAPGKLAIFADMALFSGPMQPRNCFTMNRFKRGEFAGFRVSVIDGNTGMPAADAEVVVHLTYGGKTEDVPARYRGVAGRGAVIPNLWTAKWTVPADAPIGIVQMTVTARDKSGRTAEYKPFPNEASHLTIVDE
jgi:hypothetical protein